MLGNGMCFDYGLYKDQRGRAVPRAQLEDG